MFGFILFRRRRIATILLLSSFVLFITAQTQELIDELPSSTNSISDSETESTSSWLDFQDERALKRLLLCPPLPPDTSLTLPAPIPLRSTFSPERVCLSFLVSFIGSIACLELLIKRAPKVLKEEKETEAEGEKEAARSNRIHWWNRIGRWDSSWLWLLAAAFAFGGGTTWAMHFISKYQEGEERAKSGADEDGSPSPRTNVDGLPILMMGQ